MTKKTSPLDGRGREAPYLAHLNHYIMPIAVVEHHGASPASVLRLALLLPLLESLALLVFASVAGIGLPLLGGRLALIRQRLLRLGGRPAP